MPILDQSTLFSFWMPMLGLTTVRYDSCNLWLVCFHFMHHYVLMFHILSLYGLQLVLFSFYHLFNFLFGLNVFYVLEKNSNENPLWSSFLIVGHVFRLGLGSLTPMARLSQSGLRVCLVCQPFSKGKIVFFFPKACLLNVTLRQFLSL